MNWIVISQVLASIIILAFLAFTIYALVLIIKACKLYIKKHI